jgi:hypothetical protein
MTASTPINTPTNKMIIVPIVLFLKKTSSVQMRRRVVCAVVIVVAMFTMIVMSVRAYHITAISGYVCNVLNTCNHDTALEAVKLSNITDQRLRKYQMARDRFWHVPADNFGNATHDGLSRSDPSMVWRNGKLERRQPK